MKTNEEWVIRWQLTKCPRQKNRAIKAILERNQGLIRGHLKAVRKPQEEAKDFIQYIVPTLMKAMDSFEINRGVTFCAFWTWQIKGCVSKYNREVPLIKPLRVNKQGKMKYFEELSLNHKNEDGREFIDSMPAEELEPEPESKVYADEILKILPDHERDIITKYYGIGSYPQTLIQIGQNMGVTRERIRQIKDNCFRKLKKRITQEAIMGNTVFRELLLR